MSDAGAVLPEERQERASDFLREIVRADLAAGRHQTVVTRFKL